jgi:hypothetical protein
MPPALAHPHENLQLLNIKTLDFAVSEEYKVPSPYCHAPVSQLASGRFLEKNCKRRVPAQNF